MRRNVSEIRILNLRQFAEQLRSSGELGSCVKKNRLQVDRTFNFLSRNLAFPFANERSLLKQKTSTRQKTDSLDSCSIPVAA